MRKERVFVPAALIFVLLLIIALPAFYRARKQVQRNAAENLRQVEQSRDAHALEYASEVRSTITWAEVQEIVIGAKSRAPIPGKLYVGSGVYDYVRTNGRYYIRQGGNLTEVVADKAADEWQVVDAIQTNSAISSDKPPKGKL